MDKLEEFAYGLGRVAARNWLKEHLGQQIETFQTSPNRIPWIPGPRTLTLKGKTNFYLDESNLSMNEKGKRFLVLGDSLYVTWIDPETHGLIETTSYRQARDE